MEFAHQHIKQASSIRIAALHLHTAARSRTVAVKERLLEQMVELAHCPDVEDSLYLSPLDWLFVDQPLKERLGEGATLCASARCGLLLHR